VSISKKRKDPETMNSKGKLLKGASAIAVHVFEDETKQHSIYGLAEELGLFRLGGQLAGCTDTIDARMAQLEKAGPAKRRKRRGPGRKRDEIKTAAAA
jgi:hypothetical protein